MISAVIYARYSSSNQREESIAGQLRECHAFADRNGYKVIREYTDSALTGRTDRRPGFQKMIKDSKKKSFQVVIVWKLDRFARDRYDSAVYRKILRENGVKIVSAMEAISDSPEGIILEGMLEALAEYYSANLSENIKRGNYDSALDRKMIGTRTLGYRRGSDGRYEIDPDEAQAVRRIFDEYVSGRNQQEIVDQLNRDGYRTSRGKKFTKNSLYTIIRNDRYIGMYRFKDIEDPEGIPPIVSKEQFEKAQRIMKTRENNHIATTGYALASKIYCGECGSAMTGETARSRNGNTYAYYSCVGRKSHHRNGCGMPRIRKEWIEEKMIHIVNDVILTDEVIEQFVETYREVYEKQEEDPELTMWKIQLKETEKKISNIISAIESGAYSSALQDRLRTLETDRDDLIIRIDEKSREEPPVTPEMVREFFVGLRKSAKTESKAQQTLVDVFLRRLWLFKPQKKDGPIRAVFEISTRGSSADPSTYESMLSVCSSELDTVEATQCRSNHRIIASGVSLFLITVIC